jgi:hypothetical protein
VLLFLDRMFRIKFLVMFKLDSSVIVEEGRVGCF